MKKYAVILSGGVGSRMGLNIPKQYALVEGEPIISYCLRTFFANDQTDAVVIGVAKEWKEFVVEWLAKVVPTKPVFFAEPGETRQYSVFNALEVIEQNGGTDGDVVIIHDAARPLVSQELINCCYNECEVADGVLPVISVKDTIYYSDDGKKIESLLDRSKLWAGQAPEAFQFKKYLQAHRNMAMEELLKINGSTELAYKVGMNCHLVTGDPMNFKITTPEDLGAFEEIIKTKRNE